VNSSVQITFQDVHLDDVKLRQEIEIEVNRLEKHLEWTRSDCAEWNGQIQTLAEENIKKRKERLLAQAEVVSSLGLPMKNGSGTPATFSTPLVRRERPAILPAIPEKAFKPEPALDDKEYDFILNTIDQMAQNIEQSSSTFRKIREEQIRDIILVGLNGHYKGAATGETFNSQGKTDILIRADGRNVFVAECKFWSGRKSLESAINQVLKYLTWRDTKAALILFCKNRNFTRVLSEIAATIPEHSHFKRELRRISDTHVRYLFRQQEDADRDLYLAVQVFNIIKGTGI